MVSDRPVSDLPTFYEIKAEDLHPFGKNRKRFFWLENIAIFLSQNEPIFSVSTLPNSTEITKLILNNNTSMSMYALYLL